MTKITSDSVFEASGYNRHQALFQFSINRIKNVILSINDFNRCRTDYRRLLLESDRVLDDLGLTRIQIEQAANDNYLKFKSEIGGITAAYPRKSAN